MKHHSFVIEAGVEEGVEQALDWVTHELGLTTQGNPDVIVLRHTLFSVEDARRVQELAMQSPVTGDVKVVVIAATRAYHESQNALLKLFEEPPRGTSLFFVLPSLGSLLPTLRSRVQVLKSDKKFGFRKPKISVIAEEFIKASPEKRSAIVKKLSTGRDEDERREHRDQAIALVDGVERAATGDIQKYQELLSDIARLRDFLHDRSAPVKMILEHLAIVTPKNLV
jgi:DNA polymerase III delta prime subunit